MRHRPFVRWVILGMTTLLLITFHALQTHISSASTRRGIVVNQVGYLPGTAKDVLLVNLNDTAKTVAQLVDTASGRVVATAEPSSPVVDPSSGDTIQHLDFSAVTQPGTYSVSYGSAQSVPFSIQDDVYHDTNRLLLRSYYLQRCGVELADPETGIYHAPCHVHDGVMAHGNSTHAAHDYLNATGGWHDAGDYGKYIATTAVTIGRLLSVYEQAPDRFWDGQLNIIESSNGIPDLLDEMQFGLDWMLRMQRPDGAVYRKLSGASWPIGLSPDEDLQPRYIYGVSTPETAKFAGAMAMAGRIFRPFNPDLAQRYGVAAENAWSYLQQQPQMQVNEFPEDNSGSGAYLLSQWDQEDTLRTDVDDRLWAASELFLSTGQSHYETYFVDHLDDFGYGLFEWKDPSALGMLDYVMQAHGGPRSDQIKQRIVNKLVERADRLLEIVAASGYDLANDRFIWGSNKMVAEEGITLAYAYQFTGNPAYQTSSYAQLDYLLGRNPFNQTFVTAVGTHPVQNVNHLFARARDVLIPGLVVGGPNSDAQDNLAPQGQGILSYLDSEKSYATNEYAIDYNASLIGLITLLSELSSNL